MSVTPHEIPVTSLRWTQRLRRIGTASDKAQIPKPDAAPTHGQGLPIDEALTIARQIADALGRLMAVRIGLASSGGAVEAGTPVPLFATHIGGAVQGFDKQEYVVSPDGQRFLMNTITDEAGTSPITVVLNWKPRP